MSGIRGELALNTKAVFQSVECPVDSLHQWQDLFLQSH
jgi:hypothetical protein